MIVKILFYSLFALFTVAKAQEIKSLDEIELSVWNGKLSPFAQKTLKAKEIEQAYSAQDLPFLLSQLTPSIVAYSDAGIGVGQTGFRIRGTDPSRTLFTVNGMPFNDAESQGVYIGNIPDITSSAKDILVQRGVGASSSAGGSLGASVQINTIKNPDTFQHLSISANYGSYATMRNTVSFQSSQKHGLSIDIRASQIHSDGYVQRAKANYYALYTSLNYVWKQRHLHLVYFGGITRNIQAWIGVNKMDLEQNRRKNYSGLRSNNQEPYNPKDYYDQHNLQLIYKEKIGTKVYFNNIAFAVFGKGFYDNYQENKAAVNFLPSIQNGGKGDVVNENWLCNLLLGNIVQLHINLNKQHSFQMELGAQAYIGQHLGWVYGVNNNPLPRSRYYYFPAYKYNASTQFKWIYTISPELSLYTDMQLRAVEHKIMGDRKDKNANINRFFLFANPKIGLTYSKNHHKIFLSYAYSGREPTRNELVSTLGKIPAEYLQDIEISHTYSRARLGITHTLYYMFYANQLVLTGALSDVGTFLRHSVGRSLRMGLEQEFYFALSERWKWQSNITLARNTSLPQNTLKFGQPLPFSPSIIASANLSYNPWRSLVFNLRTQYVSSQYMDAKASENLQLAPYWLQFFSIIYTHAFKQRTGKTLSQLTANVGVDNILDLKYSPNGYVYENEGYYFPAAGRTYKLKMLIHLRW